MVIAFVPVFEAVHHLIFGRTRFEAEEGVGVSIQREVVLWWEEIGFRLA